MAVTHEMGELVRSKLKYHPPLGLDIRWDNFGYFGNVRITLGKN